MTLSSLPPELLLQISSYLSSHNLSSLRLTSPQLRTIVASVLFRHLTYDCPKPSTAKEITAATADVLRANVQTAKITIYDLGLGEDSSPYGAEKAQAWDGMAGQHVLDNELSWIPDRKNADAELRSATQRLEQLLEIIRDVKEFTLVFKSRSPSSHDEPIHPNFPHRALSILNNFLSSRTTLTNLTIASLPYCFINTFTALPSSLTSFTLKSYGRRDRKSVYNPTISSEPAAPDYVCHLLSLLPLTIQSITLDPAFVPESGDVDNECPFIDTILPSSRFPYVHTLHIADLYLSIGGKHFARLLQSRLPNLRNLEWHTYSTPSSDEWEYDYTSDPPAWIAPGPDTAGGRIDEFWNSLLILEGAKLEISGLGVSRITPPLVEYIQHTSTPLRRLTITGMDGICTDLQPLRAAIERHATTLEILGLPWGNRYTCPVFGNGERARGGKTSRDDLEQGWWPVISTMTSLTSLGLTCSEWNISRLLTLLSHSPSLSLSLETIYLFAPRGSGNCVLPQCGTGVIQESRWQMMWGLKVEGAVLKWKVPKTWRALRFIVHVEGKRTGSGSKIVRVGEKMIDEEDVEAIGALKEEVGQRSEEEKNMKKRKR